VHDRYVSIDRLVDNANGTISAAIYSDPDIYQQELERIFVRTWLFVGHVSQIPKPGDYVRSRMGEEQVIVTRGTDDKVYVLLNSCPHRGNMVCRYDRGHSLAFQCSFHGWTFGSDGQLINLPPGTEEFYRPDLRKDEWGMLAARVEIFQGTIWANWDAAAPSFENYLGEAKAYLSAALCDAEGNPDGTEVAGPVMKWRVGMNWKVPMPDNDITHTWITHRSILRTPPSPTGDLAGPDKEYDVWFPEGHTTSIVLPANGQDQDEAANPGVVGDVVRDYIRARAARRRERLGLMARARDIPHIFPNIGAVNRMFRVMHPQGPTESEMWSYILVDKEAPAEIKNAMVRQHQRMWGPNGMIQKDDMENWFIQTRYSRGIMTRLGLRQNNQLGMSVPSLHGPTKFGLPGMFHASPSDENYRRFFRRWGEMMEARSWDELQINDARLVAAP
jgi:phenylpropionate dioxygenase-like ring-hydroxylating dioxygenase large terminal subunit